MPDTSIRWTCTKHLVDLLRAHPSCQGAVVEPGWPGELNLGAETVWVDELASAVGIPVATGGRKHRDDRFAIPFQIRVAARPDLDSTMSRLSELMGAIEDVLATDPTLEDFDGVVSAEVTSERQTAGLTPDGHLGFAVVEVSVHSRLT